MHEWISPETCKKSMVALNKMLEKFLTIEEAKGVVRKILEGSKKTDNKNQRWY